MRLAHRLGIVSSMTSSARRARPSKARFGTLLRNGKLGAVKAYTNSIEYEQLGKRVDGRSPTLDYPSNRELKIEVDRRRSNRVYSAEGRFILELLAYQISVLILHSGASSSALMRRLDVPLAERKIGEASGRYHRVGHPS